MNHLKNKYAIAALFAAAALAVWAVFFHAPYFKPYTWWMTHNDQQYRLEAWHSNSPFATDMVRFVLRHKSGGLAAVSQAGYLPGAHCTDLRDCRISLYISAKDPDVHAPDEWVADLTGMNPMPIAAPEAEEGSPRFWTGVERGFIVPKNNMRVMTGNVCFQNLITTVLWVTGFFVTGSVMGLGAAYFHAHRRNFIAAMAVAPSVIGLAMKSTEKIVTYEGLLGAMVFTTLLFVPLWLMAAFTCRSAMKLPEETRPQAIRCRATAYGLFAVFCFAFPFVQTYMQGSVRDGSYPQLNAASLSP